MPQWLNVLLGGGGSVGLFMTVVMLYRIRVMKRTVDVSATDQLAQTSADMVRDALEQIRAARADAEARVRATEAEAAQRLATALQDVQMARREANDARAAAQQTERVVEMWYRTMTLEAYRPTATVERWRELVTQFPPNVGTNGAMVR